MAIPADPAVLIFQGRYGAFTWDLGAIATQYLVCATDWDLKIGGDVIDATTFCSGTTKKYVVGMDEADGTINGFYNATAAACPYDAGGGVMKRGNTGAAFFMLGYTGGASGPSVLGVPAEIGFTCAMTITEVGAKQAVKEAGSFTFGLKSFGGTITYPTW